MSVSTDGQLCYGIRFEEGCEFPWDSEAWDGDIEIWWLYEVRGYENPFEIYNAQGEYIDGKKPTEDRVDEYYDTRQKFRENQPPLPVELVNYCSCDSSMYILAVPGSIRIARRGYPKEIIPADFSSSIGGHDALIRFCHDHGIEIEDEPSWWLSSLRF